ncbi:hypothetical protein PSN45_003502 [Yamadazyma tenuis]|uniref:Phosphatidylinositol N-acetylglucosaminyltransferase subunit H conserved domain-containing protein n=1 Tax=Candida tenuis (strain ATCC 10573 / BCRC 21748 / CBS 615 / JCM 9827 / NBRC 10315 / NRRL Y-1498 / VKM Y-70) TaxID=590646 RepID=G3AXX3_CANTC|nr:uncharacterized protein CANTEDRAFT_112576 [Yamadazyma tenuis ATCC 10573]XP_006684721.1 uncharacterized protein CANTEDRAFT_112576 [Yamadazyma tenuis ATCC 10573]EGV66146.1 hypothetical protein CANTEDRAFT_112576 [Yamadazyma tenuis ATCC 10573]EGV66147.1 hypothetical protein CANTEDRAFT_112576 [Yamadazyma tenuis ATCC 10573]WEJ95968.1 hypothetical protein PSN45_003502 [Yamadazyma tenuis]
MKNYDLIISPGNDNVKFTVRENSSFQAIKGPIFVVLLAYLVNILVGLRTKLSPLTLELVDYFHVAAVAAISALVYCRQEREDVMLVMKNMGIQLNSKSSWKFVPKHHKNIFVPLSDIIDLVIHEGFYGYGHIIFYMCVLTKSTNTNRNDEMIKVVFSELLPKKDLLVTVWKQSREMLFGSNKRYFRRVPGQGLKLVD